MTNMVDIPDEILLMIFEYLSTSDLINNVRKVCRRWKCITNDHTMYRCVIIDQKLSLRVVLKLLRKYCKQITSVELKRRSDLNCVLPLVSECTNLDTLKIVSCKGQVRNIVDLNNTVNVALIRHILSECEHLRTMEIRKTTFKKKIRNFYPARSVTLHCLRIKSNNDLEISEIRLDELAGLRVLELQGVKLHDDLILQRIIVNNEDTLIVLKLNIWSPPSSVRKLQSNEDELMQFIGRCSKLTKLSLQGNSSSGLTDTGFSHLAKLERMRSLTVVDAKRVSVRAIMLLFYEPHMRHLEELNLGRCPQLHQLVLKHIVDHCPNLRKLTLDQHGVECQCIDVVDLQYVVDRCISLERLELHSLNDKVGVTLPSIVQRCPNLRSFKYYVRPLKNYLHEYDLVVQRARQELPKFKISCTMQNGINGYRK